MSAIQTEGNGREPRHLNGNAQRIKITKIGRKHIFTINQIMSEHDEGTYTCHAVNEIGEAKHNFQVASEFSKLKFLHVVIKNNIKPLNNDKLN